MPVELRTGTSGSAVEQRIAREAKERTYSGRLRWHRCLVEVVTKLPISSAASPATAPVQCLACGGFSRMRTSLDIPSLQMRTATSLFSATTRFGLVSANLSRSLLRASLLALELQPWILAWRTVTSV